LKQFGVIVSSMAPRLTRISITLLTVSLLFSSIAQAENIYRWKDEDGKVYYGPVIPPEYANSPYEVLNSAGIVIETVEDPMALQEVPVEDAGKSDELEPLFTEDEVRTRSDGFLLLRYHTEEDLIMAMELEVAQLSYDIRLVNQSHSSAMVSLAAQVKNAADRQRAGVPPDLDLEKSIRALRSRLGKSDGQKAALKVREVKIRATFEENLMRYRYLTSGGTPGGVDES